MLLTILMNRSFNTKINVTLGIKLSKYPNPVILWINGASMSGAELFSEVMKHLSNVTIVDDTTLGRGCNDVAEDIQGDYWLPSGKYTRYGLEFQYYRHSCECRNLLIYKQLGDACMHRHDMKKQPVTSIYSYRHDLSASP